MGLFSGLVRARRRGIAGRAKAGGGFLCESLEPRLVLSTVVEVQTSQGNISFEMLNSAAPETVLNFMNYVTSNRYDGTFIHRSVTNFVIQMGGYTFHNGGSPEHIPTFAPVINEFDAAAAATTHQNVAQTVAIAKLGTDPNSATSEFFINLTDNSHSIDGTGKDIGLDVQNGGFTVFARVIQGWSVVQAIAGLQTTNATGAFSNLPVVNFSGGNVQEANLVTITDVTIISDPLPLFSAKGSSSTVVRGAGSTTGQTLIITVNDQGRPIAFFQASPTATWTVSDINLQSGGITLAGQIAAWVDPKDDRFYAAAPTITGLLLYTRNSEGVWRIRNLNQELPAAAQFPVAASFTVFTSKGDGNPANNDLVTIAGLNSQGHLGLFTQASKSANTNLDYPWTFIDVHAIDLAARGMATPAFVGPLASYVTGWNGQNIVGLDSSGHVQAVWRSPGFDDFRWRVSDLSQLTGAPPLSGGVTPYLYSWGGVNLAGTDANGKILVTWWNGDANSGWSTLAMTDAYGGANPAQLMVGSLSSFVYSYGGSNIAGVAPDGKIVAYWWGGPGDLADPIWKVIVLTDFIPGAIPVEGSISTTVTPLNQVNITGLSSSGHVLRYNWQPGEPAWNVQDLTALATFW